MKILTNSYPYLLPPFSQVRKQYHPIPHANIQLRLINHKLLKNLEDLVVAYLTSEYPGMDPYQVCNEHLIKASMQNQLLALNQLCINELSKRLSSQEIDKLIVQVDKSDKRNTDMEKFLCALKLKRKIAIVIPKLDNDLINLWTKKVPSWQELDSYSSLEEESDIPSSPKAKPKSSTRVPFTPDTSCSEALFPKKEQRLLRPRKCTYASSRERRTGTDVKFYRDICDDLQPKKKRNILSILKGPSNTRLAAQKKIEKKKQGLSVNAKLTQTYKLFQPIVPTENDKPEVSDYDTTIHIVKLQFSGLQKLHSLSNRSDSSSLISYDPLVNITPSLSETDVKPTTDSMVVKKGTVVKCGIKTHFVGIKRNRKGTKNWKYKCPEEDCDGTYDSVAVLNDHFRNSHLPSICEICRLRFNTPSVLSRHVYKHKKLEHVCEHCGKKFPFASDLKNTHEQSSDGEIFCMCQTIVWKKLLQ